MSEGRRRPQLVRADRHGFRPEITLAAECRRPRGCGVLSAAGTRQIFGPDAPQGAHCACKSKYEAGSRLAGAVDRRERKANAPEEPRLLTSRACLRGGNSPQRRAQRTGDAFHLALRHPASLRRQISATSQSRASAKAVKRSQARASAASVRSGPEKP